MNMNWAISFNRHLLFSFYAYFDTDTAPNWRYNIPYLLDKPGTGHNICGEVYEVDEKMLGKLDELEDHPTYYERRLEKVTMMEDKQGVIYLFHKLRRSFVM